MTPVTTGLLGFVVLVVLMLARIPVGFVMTIVGFVGFGLLTSWNASLNLLAKDFFSVFGSYNLTVIPLFVLMGQIAHYTGISGRLLRFHQRNGGDDGLRRVAGDEKIPV
jgi:C4-dicarboxylate transporter DctM subunit